MHGSLASGSQTRSLLQTLRPCIQLRPVLRLAYGRKGICKQVAMDTCSAPAAYPESLLHKDQKSVHKIRHNLSDEQAAAALAGDGHLR